MILGETLGSVKRNFFFLGLTYLKIRKLIFD
jgi:hypothetical protein